MMCKYLVIGLTRFAGLATAAIRLALWPIKAPLAQDYPAKPVQLVAPFSAGGGADSVARLFAERLSEAFGSQVFVDNRPGASNNIGTDLVAEAACSVALIRPDGRNVRAR